MTIDLITHCSTELPPTECGGYQFILY